MASRRVVTGNNNAGKSCFVHDGPTPGHLDAGFFTTDEIWIDDPGRPDPEASLDLVNAEIIKLEPPVNGSIIRIFTFPPQRSFPEIVGEEILKALARFDTGNSMEEDSPGMHTTATIDYGIVLSGEIDLELDCGEVHLKAGDVVVQRATRHAWRNRGSVPCRMAFILISSPNYR
jgi:mannose-6-phosphate isomerase-like protein (cupin superfamily)